MKFFRIPNVKKQDFLYRYQPITEYSLKNLENQQNWFSSPLNFNDPFDSDLNPQIDPRKYSNLEELALKLLYANDQKIREMINTQFHGSFEKILKDNEKRLILLIKPIQTVKDIFNGAKKDFIKNARVCCFSENYKNILMWSHYANNHSGFCLKFNTEWYTIADAGKINYNAEFPHFNFQEFYNDKYRLRYFQELVLTKAEDWDYEKEWRVIIKNNSDIAVDFPKPALVAIYLGLKITKANKEKINQIAKQKYKDIKIFQMERERNRFELKYGKQTNNR